MDVYKDDLISTIVDRKSFGISYNVYKDDLISTIVDTQHIENQIKSIKTI